MGRPPATSLPPSRRRLRLRRHLSPARLAATKWSRLVLVIFGGVPVLSVAAAALGRERPPAWIVLGLVGGPPLLLVLLGAAGPGRLVEWVCDVLPRLILLYFGAAALAVAVYLGIHRGDVWMGVVAALLLLFGVACVVTGLFSSERLLERISDVAEKAGL